MLLGVRLPRNSCSARVGSLSAPLLDFKWYPQACRQSIRQRVSQGKCLDDELAEGFFACFKCASKQCWIFSSASLCWLDVTIAFYIDLYEF